MSAVLAPPARRTSTWPRSLAVLGAAVAVVLLLYRDTIAGILHIWETVATFNHGYAVIPIALWLIWRRRDALRVLVPMPSGAWLLLIAAAGLLWLAGELAIVNAAKQLAVVAMLVFLAPAILGPAVARVILFPLVFLFFAVPIGDFLMPSMMVWTADFTVAALRLTNIPVYREGEQFVIPSGQWSVVEACSGIRYLMSSMMVGALFAYLNYRSARRRLLFMLVAIAVPVVANWLRAYLIVLTGHLTDNTVAVGADHLVYGWLFFAIVVTIMFAIGMRWAEPDAAVVSPPPAVTPAPEAVGTPLRAVAVGLLLVLLAPAIVLRGLDAGVSTAKPALPAALPGATWAVAAAPPFAAWSPAFRGAAAEHRFGFVGPDGQPVGLYVGYWRHQEGTRKLVSSEQVVAGSADAVWRRTGSASLSARSAGVAVALVAESWRGSTFAEASGAQRMRSARIYWINGNLTSSAWRAKLWGGWHKLLGRGDDAAVVVFYTPVVDGGDADRRLAMAVEALLPKVETLLRKVRDAD